MVATSSLFTSSNVAGIRFPLHASSSPPLHFLPLQELTTIRSSQKSTSPAVIDELVATPGALSKVVTDLNIDQDTGPLGQIALAIMLLGYGYTDECHNLITPLSWPDDIHFAAGPSVYHQTSTDARALATYTHCLVHRREAFNIGEFGMVGFANANFWSNAVQQSADASPSALPHAAWHAHVMELASQPDYSSCPAIQNWCQSHGFDTGGDTSFFESRAIHELCATVLRAEESGIKKPDHELLKAFAEQVTASEIRILMDKALERAGIKVVASSNQKFSSLATNNVSSKEKVATTDTRTTHQVSVDEGMAVRVMKSISSAHLDNFLTDGFIVLRRVTTPVIADAAGERSVVSAAAGIACRLNRGHACQLRDSSLQNPAIGILFPTTLEAADELAKRIGRPNDLSVGDCFAWRLSPGQTIDDLALGDVDRAQLWQLELCSHDSAEAIFVDPLFGSRGETPTSVVQWSKGTIF
jgi:hypothetical protein